MRMLLLHGFTGGATTFAHLGLDAVTPELPGHGAALPATSWEAALDGLERLLEPAPVILGGYSMGARLALALALRRPDRIARLVLASGAGGIEDDAQRARRRAQDEELARFVEQRGVAAFVERWEQNEIVSLKSFDREAVSSETVPDEKVSLKRFHLERLREQRLRHRPQGLASALRHLGQGAQPSYWADLPRLTMPVVLLAGALDAKYTALATRMHRALPGSDLRVLDCGHVIHIERPEAFTGALQ